MNPIHPNQLLEKALGQLFKRLLIQQKTAFDDWEQLYKKDNQALTVLLNSLNGAIDELKQSPSNDLNASPVTSEQLTNLLKRNQQLAEQVTTLTQQITSQYDSHQSQIHLLIEEITTLNQLNETIHGENQILTEQNLALKEQNQAILSKLDEWTTAYQQQDTKMTSLMNLLKA